MAMISKNKLSHRAEMQRSQIKNYRNNKISRLDIDVLARLCTVLNCESGDLLEFVPPEKWLRAMLARSFIAEIMSIICTKKVESLVPNFPKKRTASLQMIGVFLFFASKEGDENPRLDTNLWNWYVFSHSSYRGCREDWEGLKPW